MAQFDDGAVGVPHVQRCRVPTSAPAGHGPGDDIEGPTRPQFPEVGGLDDKADVVEAAGIGRALDQVDDGALIDAHRRKGDLAVPPLLDSQCVQPEHIDVPGRRGLDVGAREHDVVETGDTHGG